MGTENAGFHQGSNEKFRKSKVSGLVNVHETSLGFFYVSRGKDSSYLVYFPP